jgi:RHH-type proline utilization regulon transcriptional repressor/proline dehydrogenase/delta 1-pyrroline-5-carboxylate dehydrogenase
MSTHTPETSSLGAAPAYDALAVEPAAPGPLRAAITAAWRRPEPEALAPLLARAQLPAPQAEAVQGLALRLADALRTRKRASGRAGIVQGLLQEFALSSQEGVALMCLAEALLRIPDAGTRDALIRDKIAQGQWEAAPGAQPVAVRQRRRLGPAADRQAGGHPQRGRPVGRADSGWSAKAASR